MQQRLDFYDTAPDLIKHMLALEAALKASGLERSLIELVKLRASQINGCAYCLHMHCHDARSMGESDDRIQLLNAWRESPLYSERERAALAWTEALTRIEQTHAPDDVYVGVMEHFTPPDQVALTLAITTINAWNRIAIGFRVPHPAPEKE